MRRRNRWIIRLLYIAAAAVIAWLGLIVFIPVIVQQQLTAVFQSAGVEDVKFDLHSASLWRTDLQAFSAGKDPWLQIGNAIITYSPLRAIKGDIDSIHIHDGRMLVSWEQLTDVLNKIALSKSQPTSIPVRSIELQSSLLTFHRGQRSLDLTLNGTLLRTSGGASQLSFNATVEKSAIIANGTIDTSSNKSSIVAEAKSLNPQSLLILLPAEALNSIKDAGGTADIKVEYHRDAVAQTSAVVELREGFIVGAGDYAGEVRGLSAHLAIDALQPFKTLPDQTIAARSIKFAGQEFTDASIQLEIKDPNDIRISDAQFSWAGGRIAAEPFIVAISSGNVEAVLSAEHLDVAQLLALISQGRATGSGKVSGRVPVKINGSNLAFGQGLFESEGPGTLRLGESIATFAQILDQTDPRFTQDEKMKQVKQQILDAMVDFEYDRLRAELTRVNDELLVVVTIEGRGRTGARQPLNITLNFRGFEHGLNTYLAGRSRVLDLQK